MRRRRRPGFAGVIVVGLVWLVVAGCGSDDGEEPGSPPTSDPDAVVRSPDVTPVPGPPVSPGITGRVTSAGDPVEGVLLSPVSLDSPAQAVIEIAILTDRDGRYVWRLGPGAWEMTASAEGFRPLTRRVDVRQRELATLDFQLERA